MPFLHDRPTSESTQHWSAETIKKLTEFNLYEENLKSRDRLELTYRIRINVAN